MRLKSYLSKIHNLFVRVKSYALHGFRLRLPTGLEVDNVFNVLYLFKNLDKLRQEFRRSDNSVDLCLPDAVHNAVIAQVGIDGAKGNTAET